MIGYNPADMKFTQYIFFTGKGGVGKTSTACATAVNLAEQGKSVLLVSTDPASNLQDVFGRTIENTLVAIDEVPNLMVANLDPIEAANAYKESVIGPFRGQLPKVVLDSMEEQLSGSCTVEIAAFNAFSNYIASSEIKEKYDHIIFDTAPTGHTLRMLQLPSAWSSFISDNTQGASCLGQLSGLEDNKRLYNDAVDTLTNGALTTLILITRPEESPLSEAARASYELGAIGIQNQWLVINGLMTSYDDMLSVHLALKQQEALKKMPETLKTIQTFEIPLRGYNITGIDHLRLFFTSGTVENSKESTQLDDLGTLANVIEAIHEKGTRVIFTMGKGGVGKTTIAAAVALGLSKRGHKVHLSTTDPAAHLKNVLVESNLITMSHIDESEELEKYKQDVLSKAGDSLSDEDRAYIEEDLKSPCTQEIAVFRAFAEIVDRAEEEIVVIDTAPTGHTLLLLDATQSYHREIERSQGDIPESVQKLLPRLRNPDETEVIIVTHAETTPVYEAMRLEQDLHRAGIQSKWWVINASLYG
ncbi:MAG TPA: arsenical pump-driving ATPase, partial [Fusibacter sp.]|nr:arsenical pump-driving ATPase [Fusibacter sp.]